MEGHSHISPEVLGRYAADAAAEVRGVHTKQRRGARVAGHEIEVHVVVDYGANVQAVAADVQRRGSGFPRAAVGRRPAAGARVGRDDHTPRGRGAAPLRGEGAEPGGGAPGAVTP